MKLTREKIHEAFTLMGEMLAKDRQSGEILVYGGSAIMLQMAYRESTEDVDCVVVGGHGDVMRVMIAAGRKLGLPSGWLNEAVSTYRSRKEGDGDFFPFGQYPNIRRPVLKVSLAKPEYLLAMKIEALNRQHPRDIRDATMLAKGLGIETVDEMLTVYRCYFDDAGITLEMRSSLKAIEGAVKAAKDEEGHNARPRS